MEFIAYAAILPVCRGFWGYLSIMGLPYVESGRIVVSGVGDFSPGEALDLGTALIAEAKQAMLDEVAHWPIPAEQEQIIRFSPISAVDNRRDIQMNFSDLVERAESQGFNWETAWRLGREMLASDYGTTIDGDWVLLVGRSRRLVLSLEMISWAKGHSDYPGLAKETARLASVGTRSRLLSL